MPRRMRSPGSASSSRWQCSRSPCGRRCPCSPTARRGRGGLDRLEDRPEEARDRGQEGPRARPLDHDHALQPAHRHLQGRHHRARAQAVRDPDRPRRQARRARAHPGGAAAGADPPGAAARPARRGAGRAGRPARRALQGRQARHGHRRARVQRLRRPARAHRVHEARLRPGRADHRPRPHRARRGHSDRQAPRRARGSADQDRQPIEARRNAVVARARPARRPPRPFARVRSTKSTALAEHARQPPAPRGRPRGAGEGEARRSRPSWPPRRTAAGRSPAGPIRPGSGGLIWPVNGPIVSPFGMRWGRLHAGVDIAVPSGTPVHAAEVRHGR